MKSADVLKHQRTRSAPIFNLIVLGGPVVKQEDARADPLTVGASRRQRTALHAAGRSLATTTVSALRRQRTTLRTAKAIPTLWDATRPSGIKTNLLDPESSKQAPWSNFRAQARNGAQKTPNKPPGAIPKPENCPGELQTNLLEQFLADFAAKSLNP